MNTPEWFPEARDIHEAFISSKWKPGSEEDIRFLMLSLAGEVGEAANVVKKMWRGSHHDPKRLVRDLDEELGDVYVLLRLIEHYFIPDRYGLDSVVKNTIMPKLRKRREEYAPAPPHFLPPRTTA